MRRKLSVTIILVFLFVNTSVLWAADCVKCHKEKGIEETVPELEPVLLRADGKIRTITLADGFNYHGHSCPGVTTTFMAVRYGITLIYGKEIPEQGDLVIFSRSPAPGCLDMIDFIMINKKGEIKTTAPKGMKSGRDRFLYTIYSKSKNTAVDVHLKPELYPSDFFQIKKKMAAKTASEDDWQTIHGYMRNLILTLPAMSFEELFGKPEPYRAVAWGVLP